MKPSSATLVVILGCLLHNEASCFSFFGSRSSSSIRSHHTHTSTTPSLSSTLNAHAANNNNHDKHNSVFSHPGTSSTGSRWIDPSTPVNTPFSFQKMLSRITQGINVPKTYFHIGVHWQHQHADARHCQCLSK